MLLDRPRHDELAAQVRDARARLKLIPDGDISAGIAAALSSGRAGCIRPSASGGRSRVCRPLRPSLRRRRMSAASGAVSRQRVEQVRAVGLDDVEALLSTSDLAGDGVLFSATAVTGGRFLKGIDVRGDGIRPRPSSCAPSATWCALSNPYIATRTGAPWWPSVSADTSERINEKKR